MDPRTTGEPAERDTLVTSSHRIAQRLPAMVVRGLDESAVLAMAPARSCDRIHWDTVDDFDVTRVLDLLGPTARTRQWSDGQHRVWVPAGEGHAARDAIRQWCLEHEVEPVNMRVEPGVSFRDVDAIPDGLLGDLVAALVDWLYPRTYSIRRRLVADLDLVEEDDVRSMMYLFVWDHIDRFDADREGVNGTLTLAAFMLGKMRTWPQDLARTAFGRTVVSDRIAIARAVNTLRSEGRSATDVELAAALGTSVTDLRRRESAIAALSGLRYQQSLDADDGELRASLPVPGGDDVAADTIDHDSSAALTRAVLAAVNHAGTGRRAQDPLALAAVYLTFWEDMGRPQVARELEVLPKTVNAAVGRVLQQVRESDLT